MRWQQGGRETERGEYGRERCIGSWLAGVIATVMFIYNVCAGTLDS